MSRTPSLKTVSVSFAAAATANTPVLAEPKTGFLPSPHPHPEFTTGDILMEVTEEPRPPSLLFRSASPLNGWAVVANGRSAFDDEIRAAGWIFFFMAGKVDARAFGFDQSKALGGAMAKLAGRAKAQNCNSFEIARITFSRFLGISRVSISAHVRHLQKGPMFFAR